MRGRPFIGWDGEGISNEDGSHHYILFGASTGDSIEGYSLSTKECFDLLLRVEQENPDSFHVIFAGNYDVNMMLRDVPVEKLLRLKEDGICKWEGYRIEYRKGKMFRLQTGYGKDVTTITLYDVFSFFQCSFVKALRQYIGQHEHLPAIEEGKNQRSVFTRNDLSYIRSYWAMELECLVLLVSTLRDYLHHADISLSRWHGPGAIASVVLSKHKFKRTEIPSDVNDAAQCAYAGGRFEGFQIGTYEGPVYQNDKRSAYPAIIAELPSLNGTWIHRETVDPSNVLDYSLYSIEWQYPDDDRPFPFHWRATNGAVFWPHQGSGWYWGVEVRNADPRYYTIREAWEYQRRNGRPFEWMIDYYEQRAEWKREGNPAQLALKLAINSIYGKMAQQIGAYLDSNGIWKIPSFHQIEYSGYITAATRAEMYRVTMQDPSAVIAIETDAVISTRPMVVNEGEKLGDWESITYDGIMYLQSGVYWMRDGGIWKERTRGFRRGGLSPETVRQWLDSIQNADDAYTANPIEIGDTRFRTLGTHLGKPGWRTWQDETRKLRPGTCGGKREHFLPRCRVCLAHRNTGGASLGSTLHDLSVGFDLPGVDATKPSHPYPLIWKNQKKLPQWYEEEMSTEEVHGE